ncbi:MAG: hypothetical protein K2P78_08665, partial [Gemmataceae bacterium]|nr:hypothetical protein [Gemmataceae bacterium]
GCTSDPFDCMLPPNVGSLRCTGTGAGNTAPYHCACADGVPVGDFDVMPIPYADLVVTSVRAGGAASGGPLTVSWRVANDGTGLTSVGAWADRVYLARDPQEIAGTDTGFEHFGFLAVGDGYDRTGTVAVPDGLTGTVYAVVVPADPDATRGNPPPFEFVYAAGNPKVSGPIGVAPSPTADLVVSAVSGPETAAEDGTIDVIWTVRNAGLAPAAAGWTDQVFLERTVTNERTLLGTFRTDGPLDPGKTSTRQEALRLPAQLTGVYRVVVVTNVDAVVYEGTAPANNTTAAAKTLSVAVRPRPDLQAAIVEAPPTITPGGTASVGFTVTNVGTAPTAGDWTDRVYLSLDNQFSVDDLLLDEVDSKLGLQPTAVTPAEASYRSDSVSFQVPERYRGYVYFLVVTDARRQVDEWPNDDNNVAAFKTYATPLPLPDLVVSDVRVDGGSVNRGDRAGRVHGDQPRPGGDAGAGVDRDGVADPRQGPPAPRPRR